MCWTTDNSNYRNPIIAEKDLVTYKVLVKNKKHWFKRTRYYAPFQKFEYKIGKIYEANFECDINSEGVLIISKGLHSYFTYSRARTLQRSLSNTQVGIYVAIIPKGAIYYKNFLEEVVSNQLKIIKEICI